MATNNDTPDTQRALHGTGDGCAISDGAARLTSEGVARLADELVAVLNTQFNVSRPVLLRQGTNIVFADHQTGLIIRVHPGYPTVEAVSTRLRLVKQLNEQGQPLLPPVTDEAVPLTAGRCATVWPTADSSNLPDGKELGEMIAELHAVPCPSTSWGDYFADNAVRNARFLTIARRTQTPAPLLDEAARVLTDAQQRIVAATETTTDHVLVFGDPQPANTVRFGGRRCWIDHDEMGLGPREADLAIVYASERRFGDGLWDAFSAAFHNSWDPKLLDAAVTQREVAMAVWTATFWDAVPSWRAAAVQRLETLETEQRWEHSPNHPDQQPRTRQSTQRRHSNA